MGALLFNWRKLSVAGVPSNACFELFIYKTTVFRFIYEIFTPGYIDSLFVVNSWTFDQIFDSFDDDKYIERVPVPQITVENHDRVLKIETSGFFLLKKHDRPRLG